MSDLATLLTVPEAAKLLRISRNLAYDLVARGEIPAVRLGRVIRVPRASLEEWLTQHAATATSGEVPDGRTVPGRSIAGESGT